MNRVYKLIWNNARNMYIAVSEIAKSHRKETLRGGKKSAAIFLAALYLCGTGFAANTVQAESNSPVLTDEQKNEIADKVLEKLNSNENLSKKIKEEVFKYKNKLIFAGGVIGKQKSPSDTPMAFGNGAFANGYDGISLGYQADAFSEKAVSIGARASTLYNGDVAVGNQTHVAGLSAALGSGTELYANQSVALGTQITIVDPEVLELYKKYNYTNPDNKGAVDVPSWYWREQIIKNTPEIQDFKKRYARFLGTLDQDGLDPTYHDELYKQKLIETIMWEKTTKKFSKVTAIGFQSGVKVTGGVALGAFSNATRKSEVIGYNPNGEQYQNVADFLVKNNKKEAYVKALQEQEKLEKEVSDLEEQRKSLSGEKYREISEKAYEKNKESKKASKKVNDLYNAWVSVQGAVAVGNEETGMTRQITGVAAGSEDTDAVNVAQLKALNSKVDNNRKAIEKSGQNGSVKYFSVNPDNNKRPKPAKGSDNSKNDGAYGENSVAIGAFAEAADKNTLALGWSVKALGMDSLALGTMVYSYGRNSNAVGNQAAALGEESSAFGNQAKAMDMGTTALGNNAMAIQNGSTAVGYQSLSTISSTSMGTNSYALGQASLALGQLSYIGDTTFRDTYTKYNEEKGHDNNIPGYYISDLIKKNDPKIAKYKEQFKNQLQGLDGHNQEAVLRYLIIADLNKSVQFATAVGNHSTVGASQGTALGFNSIVTGESGTALGYNSTASVQGGVALGKDSVADRDRREFGYNLTSTPWTSLTELAEHGGFQDSEGLLQKDYKAWADAYAETEKKYIEWKECSDFLEKDILKEQFDELKKKCEKAQLAYGKRQAAWRATEGAVSVGNREKAITRQIIGVAAGTEDTDAVNVAQLKALNTKVDKNVTDITNLKGGFTLNGDAGSTVDVTLGDTPKPAITFKAETKNDNGAASALTAKVDADKNVTYTLNTKKLKEEMGLNNIGTGTMSSWKLKAGTTDAQAIADGDEVEFAVETADKGLIVKRDGKKIQYGINADKLVENINSATTKITNVDGDNIDLSKNTSIKTINENITKLAGKVTKVTVNGKDDNSDDANANLKIKKTEKDGQLTYDLSLNDEITIGKDGKDGKIGLNGKDGHSAEIIVGKGEDGVDGTNGKDGITRIIYKDQGNKTHEVATLDDGLKFKGDNDSVVIRKLNTQLNITGGATATDLSDGNIGVVGTTGDNGGLAVKLSKKLTGLTSAEFKDGDNITNITGGNISITKKVNNENKTVNLWDLSTTVNNFKGGFTIKDAASGTANVTLGDTNKPTITFKAETKDTEGATSALTAKVDADKNVTYTLNTKKLKEEMGLTKGVGSMSSWKLKAGTTDAQAIADGDEVEFAVETADKGLTVKRDGKKIQYGINADKLVENINSTTTKITNVDGDNIDLSKNTSIKTINENITKMAGKATKVTVDNKDDNSDDADASLKITKKTVDGQTTYNLSLNDKITIGKAGQDGKDGKIGINGKDGKSADITVGKGEDGVDGTNGKDGITRLIYKDQGNKTHEVATLDDGLKFKGDNDSVVIRKLNTQLNITGGATATDLSENNIGVVGTAGDNGGLAVKLSKKLTGLTSAEFKDGDNITNITGGNISITKKVNNQNETKNIDLWDLSTTVNNFKGGFTIKDTASGTANVTLGDTNKPAITFKAETKNDNGATSALTATVDDQKNVTYTLNTKKLKEEMGLNNIGTGTMSSWKLKVGNESTDISNGNEVTFAASKDKDAKGLSVKKEGNVITYGINKSELVGNIAGDIITEINKTTNTTKITNVDWSKFPGMNFYTQGSVNGGIYTPDASADNKWNSSHIVFGEGIKVEKFKDKDNNQVTKISLDGTGGTGTNGKDGKSAYEIWEAHVDKDGTQPNKGKGEQEFLDSLKGKDGTNGTNGTDGTNGTNGKSAYEIWEAHVDKDGTQPNKGKGEQEFLDSLKGKDGIGEDKVKEIKTKLKTEITKQMNEFKTESVRGDALGAALSALKPLDYDPYNRSQIMAGVSTYKGQEAIALGLAYYSNENTLLHAGLSYAGSSELMANAGISYRFGSNHDRKLLSERNKLMPQYKAGVISSVYVMQDEMAKLQKENTELKNEVKEANERTKQIENETNARIAKLEAQIQALIAAR